MVVDPTVRRPFNLWRCSKRIAPQSAPINRRAIERLTRRQSTNGSAMFVDCKGSNIGRRLGRRPHLGKQRGPLQVGGNFRQRRPGARTGETDAEAVRGGGDWWGNGGRSRNLVVARRADTDQSPALFARGAWLLCGPVVGGLTPSTATMGATGVHIHLARSDRSSFSRCQDLQK